MRLPKKINISGMAYTVVRTKEKGHYGGYGYTDAQEIGVNSDGHKDEKVFQTFIHEVLECIACERGLHYTSNGKVLISMAHAEFDVFAADVAAAMFPMLKE